MRTADNGGLTIDEALAYLECTAQYQQQCGDSSLIYAVIDKGEVLETEGVTAVVRSQK
jgi:flavin reductase (DIM6/NTAB) family NADH-FMN oxidoreductase RutF